MVEHFAETIRQKPFLGNEAKTENHAAIQIGYQVERLAEAIDAQDAKSLKMLAGRLGMYARSCDIEFVAIAAEKIEDSVDVENIEWMELLRDTHNLLDLCRSAQNDILRGSLEEDHRVQR